MMKMTNLFKGYVRTKDKKSLDKFKGTDKLRTLDEVSHLDEYAGILADDVILIDIDDHDLSEIMMNIVEEKQLLCRVYETTRGKHFLFKNNSVEKCKTHTKLACGLEADIKLGSRTSYEILKFDGKDRPIIYDIFDGEDYQEIPKFLTPVNSRVDFLNMEEGDGRNQTLFNYILTLQSNDFTIDEARETIEIINDFVLPEPLPEDEIEKILRDESFQKPMFYSKNQFLFDKFARYIKSNNRLIRINGSIHMYNGAIYVPGHGHIEAEMIRIIPTLSARNRTEVLKYLDLIVSEESTPADARFIAFKNGVYDLETGDFSEFSPDKVITNMIPWNYNPNAYFEVTDRTLNKISCQDQNVRALLEEAIGYCFYRRNELRKSFILIGDKANGKSTYLDMIKTLLGPENVCALDLKELGERFKTALLAGKLANIGDDIGDEFIPNPAVFKKLVSGDPINAERKGQDPFDFAPYAKLLFSANDIPRIKDKSGAVLSRLVIVPFDARFSKDDADFDPYIKYKLRRRESMEYLVQLGLEGLRRVLENSSFTGSQRVTKQIEEYEENNNPILLFFKEKTLSDFENHPTKDTFRDYSGFCHANGFNPLSNIEFAKQIKKRFGLISVPKWTNGKTVRVYVKEGES